MDRIVTLAQQNGVIRPRDLTALGLRPSQLRTLVRNGALIRAGRGLYTFADYNLTEFHTFAEAAKVQAKAVICLLSALQFHNIGTQLPHQVWVCVPYGTRFSVSKAISLKVVVSRLPGYEAGIERHRIEGVEVGIYCIAKTIADCFKYRNRIGLDVAIESLREVLHQRRCTRDEIHAYARLNRVDNIIRPYMESLTR